MRPYMNEAAAPVLQGVHDLLVDILHELVGASVAHEVQDLLYRTSHERCCAAL